METLFNENVDDELRIRYLLDVADKLNLGDGKVTENDPVSDEEDEEDEEDEGNEENEENEGNEETEELEENEENVDLQIIQT